MIVRDKDTYEINLIEKKATFISRECTLHSHNVCSATYIGDSHKVFNALSTKNQVESGAIDSAQVESVYVHIGKLYNRQTSFLATVLVLYPPYRTTLLSAIEIHTHLHRT